jgi:outer membrane protein TolC
MSKIGLLVLLALATSWPERTRAQVAQPDPNAPARPPSAAGPPPTAAANPANSAVNQGSGEPVGAEAQPTQVQAPPPPSTVVAVTKISLKQAVDEALRREVRIALAIADLKRAEALVTRARSAWLPTLYGHGSYLRLDKERRSGGALVAGRDQLLADVTLTVPLIAVKPWVETAQAKDNVAVVKLDLADVKRRVSLSTAQAYLTVIAQHRSIEVQERALENAQAHYKYAHTRFEGGIGNQIDDVRAGQEVEASSAELLRTRAALYETQEALGVLVGRDGPLDAADEVTLSQTPALEQALADATSRRGDVRADAAQLRASQRIVDDEWVEYAPLLSAQGFPFYHTPGTATAPRTGWQIQLLLTIPFYDGGARSAQFEIREANLEQGRAQYANTVRSAKSEVRVALDAVQRADETLGASARASELAGQALRMANLAYEAGAATNIEVIDAERRARDAATTVVVAEDAARQARLDLLAASGRFP